MKNNAGLRVLLIEDELGYAVLLRTLLRDLQNPVFILEHADRLQAGLDFLAGHEVDVILLDLSLPESRGLDTFDTVSQAVPHIPVVIFTNLDDESVAFEAVHRGAQDYLVKGKAEGSMIARVVRYAIERKHAQEELRLANSRLQMLDEMKSTFLSLASHELKTPITIIKGFLHVILEGETGPLTEQQAAFFKRMHQATDRLHKLVDDLLDITKIESGHVRMEMKPTDLGKLIEEEAAGFTIQAGAKEIHLEQEKEPGLKSVECDAHWIKEAVGNLISNALKYTPRGGKIGIGARNDREGVRLFVRDTGIGIKPEDQQKIFEPFQHLRPAGLEGEKSSGLGLTLVKRIVEAHGGKIEIESREGQGAMFTLVLPFVGRGCLKPV